MVVQPPPRFADKLKKYHTNITSRVDLCASAFTEIPDKQMCTPLQRALISVHKINIDLKKNVMTINTISYAIHYVFRGWIVVEKILNTTSFL